MSNVTETLVLLWGNEDADLLSDGLTLHFKNHDRWYWRDVADEGLQVYNTMFADTAEKYSPLDSLIGSVAAAAAGGVFSAIAAALGVSSSDLECAVSRWYDDQDMATPAIGLERLQQMLPQTSEPTWEHVVLGRLYHERVVHDFQDALYRSAEAHKPCIDGLDPSDITAGDNGWTWRRPFSLNDESEVAVGIDTAGEAIARAGYRVTGRGFTGSWQWLNFDTAAIRDELDEDEPGFFEPLGTVSHASLDVVQASPGDLEVAITEDLYDVPPIAVVSDAAPDATEPSGLS